MPAILTIDQDLERTFGKYAEYPDKWLRFAFPWGEPGTTLEHEKPRAWQLEFMRDLGREIRSRKFNGRDPVDPVQTAIASGHGIGKSAISAWLILFLMSTRPHAKGTITANTADQLRTKTWSELGKWLKLFIARHWFNYSGNKGNLKLERIGCEDTWRCDGITCKEENSEAFAGQHSADGSSFYLFDEGSAVPDKIYEVSDGGLTDGEPFRFLFGNPTRNTGRFRDAFNRHRGRYITKQIDSRTVEGTNKAYLQGLCDDWGEDSDYARVRVLGLFPRAASSQFIPEDQVRAAMKRHPISYPHEPLICSCDVARYGGDQSVVAFRRGRDAQTIPWLHYRGVDLMTLAGVLAEIMHGSHYTNGLIPDALFVDGAGLGAGVIDRLRQLRVSVIEVNGGHSARNPKKYFNRRAEMYGLMRDWMPGGCIPDDENLCTDLIGIEYGFGHQSKTNAIKLETKEEMKKRGLDSPDDGDALAGTFYQPVFSLADDRYTDIIEPEYTDHMLEDA